MTYDDEDAGTVLVCCVSGMNKTVGMTVEAKIPALILHSLLPWLL